MPPGTSFTPGKKYGSTALSFESRSTITRLALPRQQAGSHGVDESTSLAQLTNELERNLRSTRLGMGRYFIFLYMDTQGLLDHVLWNSLHLSPRDLRAFSMNRTTTAMDNDQDLKPRAHAASRTRRGSLRTVSDSNSSLSTSTNPKR